MTNKIKEKAKKIISIFQKKDPVPLTELNYSTSFELLVAVILSAQTTDKQVNKVTSSLFKEYNTPEDFARIKQEDLQQKIKSIGLYRNKSKYIIKTARILKEKHQEEVPQKRGELMKLPGVGRKTASVILGCIFKRDTFPVDTHVFRVSRRIGLATEDNIEDVEKQLKKNIPRNKWFNMHHWLINHGRQVCKARNPDCENCQINKYCDFYQGNLI